MTDREFIKRLMLATESINFVIADVCQQQLKGADNDTIRLSLYSLPRYSFGLIPNGEINQYQDTQIVFDNSRNAFMFRQEVDRSFSDAIDFGDSDFETLDGFIEQQ